MKKIHFRHSFQCLSFSLLMSGALVMSIFASCNSSRFIPGEKEALADMVSPIPMSNVQKDSAWNIWCGTMVKGYDGKYHLYYSRWPRRSGHESWVSHSQIAYAVADKPEGPYRDVNVPLPVYNDTAWDGAMAHNPYAITVGGKYYLYYIATKGTRLAATDKIVPYGEEWWKRRDSERIGVAVADNPAGPWKRMNVPVLDNSKEDTAFDAMCVANPAVCVGRNGKIVMLYKGVCKNGTIHGGKVRFSVAFADSPAGPFRKTYELIFQPKDPKAGMVAEDPFLWYDKKLDKYYAITRDVIGQFTGEVGGLALLQSVDAIHWVAVKHPKVVPTNLKWADGTVFDKDASHIERPFLYFDKSGRPVLLFGAMGEKHNGIEREHSFNVRIPFISNGPIF
jgi:hypothetical protein